MEKAHVLIVEDNHDFAFLSCRFFKKAGITAVAAYTGEQGLEEITNFRPDVIVMDLSLPDMAADEFVKSVRKVKDFKTIPIIVASGNEAIVARTAELECQDYLKKPFDHNVLVKKVLGYIRQQPQLTPTDDLKTKTSLLV